MAQAGESPGPAAAQPRPGTRERPLRVGQLLHGANRVLDRQIGTIWIEGEVESLVRASSGHLYFALKDARSQIRAVMWRSDAARLKFRLEDGLSVRCRGRVAIYDRDGKFQFYAQVIEPAGLGADALAFEQLKAKLAAAGLFAAERKRPLPLLPRRIGVVTSKSGAAVRDIIRAVQRRFPVPILIADARVQGPSAPAAVARAIAALCRCPGVDVIIVGRGGGSAGDLAAFNDERVVRAVVACTVPVISAVGHEIDLSLTDLAADRRAATPTMAGEMAVPVLADMARRLAGEERRLRRELDHRLRVARQDLDHLDERMKGRVSGAVAQRRRRLGDAQHRLETLHPRRRVMADRARLAELHLRLDKLHPRKRLLADRARLAELSARATDIVRRRVQDGARRFGGLGGRLDALSPLRVLERGYALARAGDAVVTSADQVAPGDALTVRLRRGQLGCRVETVEPGNE
ncbi:MAG TPA: exodeoxyribonuclease VII large subunit [Kofleriaceae bacterium]|nr:exodeoxyribonuclease VII large subunit [Kofleriaceae bacterium]